MAFEAFVESKVSSAYVQRLGQGFAIAACMLVGIGAVSARMMKAPPAPPKVEEPTEVKFVEEIPEPEKLPEPPPAAPVVVPDSVKVNHEPPPPPPPVPTEIPQGKLEEADPSKDKGMSGAHGGDPGGAGSGTGTVVAPPPPPPPPPTVSAPPPPPAPKGPSLVSETDTPAKALVNPAPPYPAAARAAGLMGAVTVRITIDESGDVTDVKVVKGDPNFDDAVVETVKKWKFTPAKHEDGTPFKTTIVRKFPFKIKAQ